MHLFIDIETTGLPRKEYKGDWRTHYNDYPRIVSAAWKYEGVQGKDQYYIANDCCPIPPAATAIHNITDEFARKSAFTGDDILVMLIEDAMKAQVVIGFNIFFDTSIIQANARRYFGTTSLLSERCEQAFDKIKRFDVMGRSMKHFHGMKSQQFVHKELFSEEFKGHNALADVHCLEKIHTKLKSLNAYKSMEKLCQES